MPYGFIRWVRLLGDNRPVTYPENGKIIYRASSVGNCIKSLAASRLGYAPQEHPDWLLTKFAEGNDAEPIILDWVSGQGEWELLNPLAPSSYAGMPPTLVPRPDDGQFLVEIPLGERVLIRCHLDGMAVCVNPKADGGFFGLKKGMAVVVEVKGFGQSFWDKFDRDGIAGFPYYATQVSIQMHGTGLPCMFVVAKKGDDGKLERGDDGKLVTRVVYYREAPVSLAQIKVRIARAEGHVARGMMPECDYRQYPCQYFWLHDDEDEIKPEKPRTLLTGSEATKLNALAEEYLRGSALEKEGRKMKDTAKENWRKFVANMGGAGGTGGGLSAEAEIPFILETDIYEVEHTVRPMPEKIVRAHVQKYPTVKSKSLEREKMKKAGEARVE